MSHDALATQVVNKLSDRYTNLDGSIKLMRIGTIAFLVQVIIDKNQGTIYADVAQLESELKCDGLTINRQEGQKPQAIVKALQCKQVIVLQERRNKVMTFWLSPESEAIFSDFIHRGRHPRAWNAPTIHRHVAPYAENRGTVTVFQPQRRKEIIERQPYIDQMAGIEDASDAEDHFMEDLATSDPGARNLVEPAKEVLDVVAFNHDDLQVQFADWNHRNDEPQRPPEFTVEKNNQYESYASYNMQLQVHQQREKVSSLDLETKREETVTAKVLLETAQVQQQGQTERAKLEFEIENRKLELEFIKLGYNNVPDGKKKRKNSVRSERSERSQKKKQRRASESDVGDRLLQRYTNTMDNEDASPDEQAMVNSQDSSLFSE